MKLPIPKEALEQHIITLGKTGSGKSSAMRVIVEYLLDRKQPVIIVDPKGDWYGLKSSANGKQAGYPIVIFGGAHADVPLNPRSGVAVAELLATGNRSAVLDLRGWMPGEMTQFWIDFASSLFRFQRGKRWLVIDEVHNFAPKGKILDVKAGTMLHWSKRLAGEGRGLGLNIIAASQRPQKVHNDVLTSCETLIGMRVIHKADRDAFEDWIEGCGDEKSGAEVLRTLAQMKRGDAWVWSPEIEFGPKQIHFPMFKTFDSFQPRSETAKVKLRGWADVNLTEVKTKLESFVKEAEENDPEKLKTKVRNLAIAISIERKKFKELEASESKSRPKSQFLSLSKSQSKKLIKAILFQELEKWRQWYDDTKLHLEYRARSLGDALKAIEAAVKIEFPEQPKLPNAKSIALQLQTQSQIPESKPQISVAKSKPLPPPMSENGERRLSSGALRILAAVAQWHPQGITEGQARAQAGLKKSGTWSTYLSRLRSSGLIRAENNLLYVTSEGLEKAGASGHSSPSTTEEVLAIWKPKLSSGARKILDAILARQGQPVSVETIMQETGFAQSGTLSTYLSHLRTAQLIKKEGGGYAANKEVLFL